jgi:hypothetical protein
MFATFCRFPSSAHPQPTPTGRTCRGPAARTRQRARLGIECLEDRLVLNGYSPATAGLVAWWAGEGNANDVIGGHNGTLVGGTYGPGFLGTDQAFQLDGVSSYVQVPNDPAWNLGSSDFTIDLWVNYSALRADSISQPQSIFMGHDEGPGDANKWFFAYGGGDLYWHMNSPATGPLFLALAPFTPNLNQWYNLALTRSGSTFAISVNGAPISSEDNANPVPDASAPLTLGAAESPPGDFFLNGGLDDVVLYNRALSPQDLAALANPQTVTTVASSANPAVFGQPVTLTATVSNALATPTGTVDFVDTTTGTPLGSATLANGTASVTTAALSVGAHTITATYRGGTGFACSSGSLGQTVNPDGTTTTLTASDSLPLSDASLTFTATVTANVPGGGTPTGTVDFVDTTAGSDLGSSTLVNGVATLNVGALAAGSHALTATYSGDGNFLGSAGTASVTALAPASLSGTVFADFNDDGQVDFGENGIAGVPMTLTGTDDLNHTVSLAQNTDGDGAFVFLHLRPGSYFLTEASQPAGFTQGINSVGTAGGSLAAADQFSLQLVAGVNGLNYNYGEQPAPDGRIQRGQAASISFWNNRRGQALIRALNGGTGTQLADWLAATLPSTFGARAGGHNLAGKNNAFVAALLQQDFVVKGIRLDAQVLATALSVYVTNATLDDTGVGTHYGFTVSGDGVGTATVNVGCNGDAFGVANHTTMRVLDLLLAADAQAVDGLLYNGNVTRRKEANDLFSAVNQAGHIS